MTESQRQGDLLPQQTRRLHRALLDGFLAIGNVLPPETLAETAGIALTDLPTRLQELAAADYAAVDDAGRLTCLYPLSPSPTPHTVVIDGQRRFAMCAIDALGIPAMLGRELAIEGRCAFCGARIGLRVRPGSVVAAEPESAAVVARWDRAEPAFAACCPFTVFVCGHDHAQQVATRIANARTLPLPEAITHAEEIFGGLLADALPATRRRGMRWERSHGA